MIFKILVSGKLQYILAKNEVKSSKGQGHRGRKKRDFRQAVALALNKQHKWDTDH